MVHPNKATAELTTTLSKLDRKAESLGPAAEPVRQSISSVLEDLTCPAGKENARLAIPEIRQKLNAIKRTSSRPGKEVANIE